MKRLEHIISAYWEVGTALRHPDAPALTTEQAFKRLGKARRLRPEEWKLAEQMHTLKFDIIEGNTQWRHGEQQKVQDSKLIHHLCWMSGEASIDMEMRITPSTATGVLWKEFMRKTKTKPPSDTPSKLCKKASGYLLVGYKRVPVHLTSLPSSIATCAKTYLTPCLASQMRSEMLCSQCSKEAALE
jgi:hypothetical protein